MNLAEPFVSLVARSLILLNRPFTLECESLRSTCRGASSPCCSIDSENPLQTLIIFHHRFMKCQRSPRRFWLDESFQCLWPACTGYVLSVARWYSSWYTCQACKSSVNRSGLLSSAFSRAAIRFASVVLCRFVRSIALWHALSRKPS